MRLEARFASPAAPMERNLTGDHAAVLEHADIRNLTPEQWRQSLLTSIYEPVQDGRRYPGFPDETVQKAFVGSAYEDAINEGFNFYRHLQNHLANRRFKVASSRYLDFGAGWGRISRLFLRDFERGDMTGVDVDESMVSFCNASSVPGGYFPIAAEGTLPFADAAFRLVTAYSVFTHLPEPLFKVWLLELLRVTAPGGLIAFTVEPERFLDFMANVDPAASTSPWHVAVQGKLGDLGARRRELHAHGLTYIPTGGGAYRPPERYGETIVTPKFVQSCVAGHGEMLEFFDEADQFWQAVVVVRRNRWPWLAQVMLRQR